MLYSFFKMLTNFFGHHDKLVSALRSKGGAVKLMLPFCFTSWRRGSVFVNRTSFGVFQYVVLRVVLSILTLIFETKHIYGEVRRQLQFFYRTSHEVQLEARPCICAHTCT